VGDGDLSYSAKLAPILVEKDVRLIASVLEDQESHRSVYSNSKLHTETIQRVGQSALFGVDATCLETRFNKNIQRLIFNFPHWRGKSNTRYNRQLLDEFLSSAALVLEPERGEIHVALCEGQGGGEATDMQEWRGSWMAAAYAAQAGLLLRRIEPFEHHASYDQSSHRGADRAFFIGTNPLLYVFSHPNGKPIEMEHQVAYRHELRIRLDPTDLQACRYSIEDLCDGDIILDLAKSLAPQGIRVEIPMRDVVKVNNVAPLLIFLLVYSGDSMPLTRTLADQTRSRLEEATVEELGMQVVKRNRMVSKPFPYSLLKSLTRTYSP
jgi:hypothetical protein